MFKTITCNEFRKQVELFSLDLLDPVQRERFRYHANICPECAEYDEEYVANKGLDWWLFTNMPETPEEEWIRRHCISDDTIDEYNEGTLTLEERRIVNNHLYREECDYCLSVIHANAWYREMLVSVGEH